MKLGTITARRFVDGKAAAATMAANEDKSAKALGFKKGDLVHTGLFPGVIVSDVHTKTPICEVWGAEHELGGVSARDLRLLDVQEFAEHAAYWDYDPANLEPFTIEAKQATAKLGVYRASAN